jgi:MATE family multidrug resistance protein
MAFPEPIARIFTRDASTIAIALVLFPIAGMFQIFDGIQVVAAAILRGTGDTRWPMIIHVMSFWAVGIPFGLLLAFPLGFGAPGLWWGLTAGLASTAVLQLWRARTHLARELVRVRIE